MRPIHDAVSVKGYAQTYHRLDALLISKCNQYHQRTQSFPDPTQLPDFVVALEKYGADRQSTPSRSPALLPSSPPLKPHTPEPSSSRASPVPNKLRYAAYEPPRPTQRLRRMSSSSSRHSDDGGPRSRSYQDPMSMTVTAGDLTIAAQTSDLRSIPSVRGHPCAVPIILGLSYTRRVLLGRPDCPHFPSCRYWTKSHRYAPVNLGTKTAHSCFHIDVHKPGTSC